MEELIVVCYGCGHSGHMRYECPTKNNLHVGIKGKEEVQEKNDVYVSHENDHLAPS